MINVSTIDIKHWPWPRAASQLEKLGTGNWEEDAIIDGLFTVSTVRYDNEIWPQGGLSLCLENVCSQ